jgi:hypothetical protein
VYRILLIANVPLISNYSNIKPDCLLQSIIIYSDILVLCSLTSQYHELRSSLIVFSCLPVSCPEIFLAAFSDQWVPVSCTQIFSCHYLTPIIVLYSDLVLSCTLNRQYHSLVTFSYLSLWCTQISRISVPCTQITSSKFSVLSFMYSDLFLSWSLLCQCSQTCQFHVLWTTVSV